MKLQNQIISLKTATQRRAHIEQQFGQQHIEFEFFDAITPDQALVLTQQMKLKFDERYLTKGELACFMSHVSLWQKIVDQNLDYLAIFEDDIFLGECAEDILNSTQWIGADWDVIKIEAFSEKAFLGTTVGTVGEEVRRTVAQLKDKNLGTAGYILSQKGAQTYLSYIQNNVLHPLDELMFEHFIRDKKLPVYQMNPAVCIQEMMLVPKQKATLESKLFDERKMRMKNNKKRGLKKIQMELVRLFRQIRDAIFSTKVTFK